MYYFQFSLEYNTVKMDCIEKYNENPRYDNSGRVVGFGPCKMCSGCIELNDGTKICLGEAGEKNSGTSYFRNGEKFYKMHFHGNMISFQVYHPSPEEDTFLFNEVFSH